MTVMAMDREKIISLLKEMSDYFRECRSNASLGSKAENHFWELQIAAQDAATMLEEQEDLGTELTNAVELIHKKNERIEKLIEEQESKAGHWILNDEDTNIWECSEYGSLQIIINGTPHDNGWFFCPHCGAKLEGYRSDVGNE